MLKYLRKIYKDFRCMNTNSIRKNNLIKELNNNSQIAPVSILMCVFNDSGYLQDAINSVTQQTWKNFEFIIVDDGSDDNTPEILSTLSNYDNRIKIFRKQNSGLTASLNYGLRFCSAPLIARIDSDDLWSPEKLEVQMNFMQKHPSISLLGSSAYLIRENGRIISTKYYPSSNKALRNNLLKKKGHFPHSSVIIRKKILDILGGYDESFKKAQDYELWLRISSDFKISCIKKPLVSIRKHANQISSGDTEKQQFFDSRRALIKHELSNMADESNHAFNILFQKAWTNAKPLINEIFILRKNIKIIKTSLKKLQINNAITSILVCLLSPRIFFKYLFFGEDYKKYINDVMGLK